jgi:hypothetical protein
MLRLPTALAAITLLAAGATSNVWAKSNNGHNPHGSSTATPTPIVANPGGSGNPTNTPSPSKSSTPVITSPTATSTATPQATPSVSATPIVTTGKLRYRSVDVMKLTKDVINNQPSDSQIAIVVAAVRSMHVTHVAFSVPLDSNGDFVQYGNNPGPRTIENFTLAWANAIHGAGLHVLFRGTLGEFEQGGTVQGCGTSGHMVVGIYNFPFDVTGQCSSGNGASGQQTQTWWLNKLQARLTTLSQSGAFQAGDIIAALPEPQSNHNFWDSSWNFLGMNNQPSLYASFFESAKQAEDNALTAAGVSGVQTGFTSDNGSMFLSAGAGGGNWVPPSYMQGIGTLNVDHYGSDGCGGNPQFSWQEMLCGLQDISSHYNTPILHQEWADINGYGASYVQSMLNNAFLPEVQAGAYVGLNYWDPGCGNPGSVFNCDYTLTPTGQTVAAWFGSLS